MKKMNNKGFAISTLLYGLMLVAFLVVSLLISIMSTNRKNTSTLIRKIEEELNRYSQTVTEITSTDGAQEFIIPYGKAGWYKIELWGAGAIKETGDPVQSSSKRGSYTSGIIYLKENDHIYFQIGTQGAYSGSTNNNDSANGAGGSTDVRIKGGNWGSFKDSSGVDTRIMIAAGGGTSSATGGGVRFDASAENNLKNSTSNDGGSYISGMAGQPINTYGKFLSPVMYSGVNDGIGKAKIELISEADEDKPPTKKTTYLNNVRYIRDCINISATQTEEYWKEIQAITPSGENVAKKSGVTIKFGAYGSTETTSVNGLNDGSLKAITGTTTSSSIGQKCILVDLGTTYNLEEIAIFHNTKNATNQTKKKKKTAVGADSNTPTVMRQWTEINYAPVETYEGVRISDRNPENISNSSIIKTGNYYIESALSDYRVVTVSGGTGQLSIFNSAKTQRWSVTHLEDRFYRVLEGGNQYVLKPENGAEEASSGDFDVDEYLVANTKYKAQPWEKWAIVDVGYNTTSKNGYYMFHNGAEDDWCMAVNTSSRDTSALLKMKKCDYKDKTQWFKLVNADY